MDLKIGDKAPDFVLFDTNKQQVKLSDYRGKKVVLLFFPFAFSSVCTAELCGVRDNFAQYEGLGAQPIGISVDSLYTLARFRKDEMLTFPLLSDFNKHVSASYGVLYDTFNYGMKGVSKRAAFVIDAPGVIRHIEILDDAGQQPNFETIQKVLSEI